ncbi:hypothetical protein, partial [Escherichia coli]|uniref:hypothetical protein n=1 Tax=Escherichia coli TaxID=562 RepID=UPI0024E2110C
DAHYVYRHDEYGRLAEKPDRNPEGGMRMHDERTHHHPYDSQHRLVFYPRRPHAAPPVRSRYLDNPRFAATRRRVRTRGRPPSG